MNIEELENLLAPKKEKKIESISITPNLPTFNYTSARDFFERPGPEGRTIEEITENDKSNLLKAIALHIKENRFNFLFRKATDCYFEIENFVGAYVYRWFPGRKNRINVKGQPSVNFLGFNVYIFINDIFIGTLTLE